MRIFLLLVLLFASTANAHEMVPTYPEWNRGIYPGVLTTRIEMFNKRSDVEYYEIGLFDKDWNEVYFVADYKVFKLQYLSSIAIDIFIARENRERVEYVCSRSKIRKDKDIKAAVSSRICSRFRK